VTDSDKSTEGRVSARLVRDWAHTITASLDPAVTALYEDRRLLAADLIEARERIEQLTNVTDGLSDRFATAAHERDEAVGLLRETRDVLLLAAYLDDVARIDAFLTSLDAKGSD
jgi:hypothetical protein